MCLVYRFSRLCNNVALHDKLRDSPFVDLARCYEKKNMHLLFYHTLQLSFILEVNNDKSRKCRGYPGKFHF